jgi:hypothetical protein
MYSIKLKVSDSGGSVFEIAGPSGSVGDRWWAMVERLLDEGYKVRIVKVVQEKSGG